MKLYLNALEYFDTNEPLDLSLTLTGEGTNVIAWYRDQPEIKAFRDGDFIGEVASGASVNFRDIRFNPHAHGTHTECLGHITQEIHSVNQVLKNFFFDAEVVTIRPEEKYNSDGSLDYVISLRQLEKALERDTEALIIRTFPNDKSKKTKNYSHTNPAYLDVAACSLLLKRGVKHLLIDLPSVDKENDQGELAFHHAFWEVPQRPNFERTITEMIYVDNEIEDGKYILELQMASFNNDAAPSRPLLYKIKKD